MQLNNDIPERNGDNNNGEDLSNDDDESIEDDGDMHDYDHDIHYSLSSRIFDVFVPLELMIIG